MVIERTSKEVIIRLPSYVDTDGLQRLVDYLTYKEATAKSKAKQADVNALQLMLNKVGGKKTEAALLNENRS